MVKEETLIQDDEDLRSQSDLRVVKESRSQTVGTNYMWRETTLGFHGDPSFVLVPVKSGADN